MLMGGNWAPALAMLMPLLLTELATWSQGRVARKQETELMKWQVELTMAEDQVPSAEPTPATAPGDAREMHATLTPVTP